MTAAAEALPFVSEASAKTINDEHIALLEDCRASQERAGSARDRAVKIGQELARVKEAVGHGNYLAWIKANCAFSDDTANNYTKFAKALNSDHARNLPADLSLRAAMVQLGIVPQRPREGGGTLRGGGIPSVYDALNKLTAFLGAVDNSGVPQAWETDPDERSAVQRQYAPKLQDFILRLYGVRIELPALGA